jgi:hypothetical protein
MNNWTLGEKRLKYLMDAYNLNTQEVEAGQANTAEMKCKLDALSPSIPVNALVAQLNYREESGRAFKLYAVGDYDFSVQLSGNMEIHVAVSLSLSSCVKVCLQDLQTCHDDVADWLDHFKGKATPEKTRSKMPNGTHIMDLWCFYRRAAEKAGIPEKHVLRQFEAE